VLVQKAHAEPIKAPELLQSVADGVETGTVLVVQRLHVVDIGQVVPLRDIGLGEMCVHVCYSSHCWVYL